MRIFGLNILTDKKLNDYGWAFHREHQTPEYLAQVQDVYQDRWERAQEKIKALEAEIKEQLENIAGKHREEIERYRQVQIELQDFTFRQNEEINRLNTELMEMVEARTIIELLRRLKAMM